MEIPTQIDRERTPRLAARFDEAMDTIANEFTALDPHQQCRNAFWRLSKWDPLGRVLMLGTGHSRCFSQRWLDLPPDRKFRGDCGILSYSCESCGKLAS